MRKLFVFFFFLLIFWLSPLKISAVIPSDGGSGDPSQGPPPPPDTSLFGYIISTCPDYFFPNQPCSLPIDPNQIDPNLFDKYMYIDGNTLNIKLTFTGLSNYKNPLFLCPATDSGKCMIFDGFAAVAQKNGFLPGPDGSKTYTICGNGEDTVKGDFKDDECKPDRSDWFHEGHAYRLGLFSGKGLETVNVVSFYVKHSVPLIKLTPIKPSGGATDIKLTFWGTRPGGDDQNDYQIAIEGRSQVNLSGSQFNVQRNTCLTVNESKDRDAVIKTIKLGDQKSFDSTGFNYTDSQGKSINIGTLAPGNYMLKINEQDKEGGLLGTGIGGKSCSGGGFTYLEVPFTISKTKPFSMGKVTFDPDEIDTVEEEKVAPPNAPCAPGQGSDDLICKALQTGIGPINTTPGGFIGSVFSWVLTLAAAGAIIIIVYSGYILITSGGNKEKIAGARETLTSAIVGLLFIIFALVILETIGVDILRIPGFSR